MVPTWMRHYQRRWLRRDLVAGITLWGLVAPAAIAYAGIAKLDPEAGLYALVAGLVLYALIGTSNQLVAAPTSATAVLLAASVTALRPADREEYLALAAAMVVAVGAIFVIAGVARLGFVSQFLSRPVTDGFVVGLAIYVATTQLAPLLGVPQVDGTVPRRLWGIAQEITQVHALTLTIGIVALVMLFVLARLPWRVPGGLVVVVLGIAAGIAFDLEGNGVALVGSVPKGFPAFRLPDIAAQELWTLIPAAAGIVVVGYSEGLAVAENLARQHRDEIDPNRELLAYGAANVVSGFAGGMVVCGGMSPSALNDEAGARSPVSLLTSAAATVLTLVFLAQLLSELPLAVLAALIIYAASTMMRFDRIVEIGRLRRSEMALALLALFGVVLVGVLEGLAIAAVTSLLVLLYRASQPHVVVLGALPHEPGWGNIERHPEAVTIPGLIVIRLDTPLWYVNASTVQNRIQQLVTDADPPVRAVVLDSEVQFELDVTSLEVVDELFDWFEERELTVLLVQPHSRARRTLRRGGVMDRLPDEAIVRSIDSAVEVAGFDPATHSSPTDSPTTDGSPTDGSPTDGSP